MSEREIPTMKEVPDKSDSFIDLAESLRETGAVIKPLGPDETENQLPEQPSE